MGSDLLFSMPSFLSGAARTLDLGGTYTQYNVSATPKAADSLAMMHDLAVVGKDCGKEVVLDEQTKKALAKK